ncbi:MAG: hypothetical protein K2H29_04535 [Oscillospiraceae bacterium]|nr:hypothetical protein [Oscillospiraceae bacterium]
MLVNQAENIMIGSTEVQKVFLGNHLVWKRNQRFRQFVLNTKRFSAENPVLYSTGGAKIADVSAQYGDLADKVYVTPDGLHVSGDTRAAFPVDLPASGKWTIIYRIKDCTPINSHPGYFVHHLFDSSDRHLETAYVSNWDSHAMHFRLIRNRNGNYTLYPGARISEHQGFYDDAVWLSDLQYYQLEYRWINDGNMLSLYVNGVKRAAIQIENLKDISELFFALDANESANEDSFIVTHFELKSVAELPVYTLYRWKLINFRGSDNYTQMKRLCLYDVTGNRLDTACMSYAFACYENGACVSFPNDEETCRCLINNQDGKTCIARAGSQPISIFVSIPGNTPMASYSYITGGDLPERDPVSWILSRSIDGGETWTEIDTQQNVSITTERDTETQRFSV